MNGPEHYRRAEELLAGVQKGRRTIQAALDEHGYVDPQKALNLNATMAQDTAEAHVHALMAGVADTSAIAEPGDGPAGPTCPDHDAPGLLWGDVWVCSTGPRCTWRQATA